METKIHQALCHIFNRDFLKLSQVQNTLMRHSSVCALVQNRIMRFQPSGNVVGVEYGVLGGGL